MDKLEEIRAFIFMKQRVIFYIDGFNFYFGLRSKNWRKYYWLDMVNFCQSFLKPDQELIEVNYFSATPLNKLKADRQDLFFSANKLNPKFNLYMGKYLKKKIICRNCKDVINSYEEKQTDVHIATKMIRDIILDRKDITILVSADSDLIPPIDLIREIKPLHQLFVYLPPGRFSYDLTNKANSSILLERYESRFAKHLLPNEVIIKQGVEITRPANWY